MKKESAGERPDRRGAREAARERQLLSQRLEEISRSPRLTPFREEARRVLGRTSQWLLVARMDEERGRPFACWGEYVPGDRGLILGAVHEHALAQSVQEALERAGLALDGEDVGEDGPDAGGGCDGPA